MMTELPKMNPQIENVNGRLMHYLGSCNTDFSKYPVNCFIDVTNGLEPKVHLQLTDFGDITYPLANVRNAYQLNTAVRATVRAYEDYLFDLVERQVELNTPESTFYDWLISR